MVYRNVRADAVRRPLSVFITVFIALIVVVSLAKSCTPPAGAAAPVADHCRTVGHVCYVV